MIGLAERLKTDAKIGVRKSQKVVVAQGSNDCTSEEQGDDLKASRTEHEELNWSGRIVKHDDGGFDEHFADGVQTMTGNEYVEA